MIVSFSNNYNRKNKVKSLTRLKEKKREGKMSAACVTSTCAKSALVAQLEKIDPREIYERISSIEKS